MKTAYDWITIALFAALIVLFMHRSTMSGAPRDSLWQYLIAAVGCAVVNQIGNAGYDLVAIVCGAAVLAYVHFVLRPLDDLKL